MELEQFLFELGSRVGYILGLYYGDYVFGATSTYWLSGFVLGVGVKGTGLFWPDEWIKIAIFTSTSISYGAIFKICGINVYSFQGFIIGFLAPYNNTPVIVTYHFYKSCIAMAFLGNLGRLTVEFVVTGLTVSIFSLAAGATDLWHILADLSQNIWPNIASFTQPHSAEFVQTVKDLAVIKNDVIISEAQSDHFNEIIKASREQVNFKCKLPTTFHRYPTMVDVEWKNAVDVEWKKAVDVELKSFSRVPSHHE